MPRPNLFILGAPKCGTTSLANWLGQHPQVYMSALKEPHYFSSDFAVTEQRTEADYLALFDAAEDHQAVIGEASVWYLRSQVAVPAIQAFNPDAKFIVMLRNPVTMAPSLHAQTLVNGDEDETDFARAWHLQSARRAQPKQLPKHCRAPELVDYALACQIGEQLQRVQTHVNGERLFTIFLEDLSARRTEVWKQLCEFLEIDAQAAIDFEVHNRAQRWRFPIIMSVERSYRSILRRLGINPLGFGILRRARQVALTDHATVPPNAALRREMQATFADDIALLGRLTQRNLDHWLSEDG